MRADLLIPLMLLVAAPVTLRGQAPVSVVVLGEARPSGELVTLADVAQVTGGDLIIRRKIASLDIAKLDPRQPTGYISKQQIEVRILLAGIAAGRFRVEGAERVFIGSSPSESVEQRIFALLQPDVAARLEVEPDDVHLRLARPLSDDAKLLFSGDRRVEHFLRPNVRTGPLYVKLAAYEGDSLVRTTGVWLDVEVVRPVMVAARTLELGTVITAEDVVQRRQVVSEQTARSLATDIVGKQTRRRIKEGEVLRRQTLASARPAKREIVIRSRDLVDLIAKKNALQVKVSGAMAMQSGAVGEAIRVKNPRSGKILTAKVLDGGTVEIKL